MIAYYYTDKSEKSDQNLLPSYVNYAQLTFSSKSESRFLTKQASSMPTIFHICYPRCSVFFSTFTMQVSLTHRTSPSSTSDHWCQWDCFNHRIPKSWLSSTFFCQGFYFQQRPNWFQQELTHLNNYIFLKTFIKTVNVHSSELQWCHKLTFMHGRRISCNIICNFKHQIMGGTNKQMNKFGTA